MFFKKKKTVGLALGSGGPRGIAHIGVIKALVENDIPIDYISGCSAGALIGGLYAYYGDIEKVAKHFSGLTYSDLLKIFADPRFAHGILKGEKALKTLYKWVGKKKIEKLETPFSAVATDLENGETVILEKGELALAIRASASIPVFFRPAKVGRRILVDGGNSMPIPAEVVRNMGADIVIASDLDACYVSKKNQPKDLEKMSMTEIAERSLDILQYSMAKENIKHADVVISPDVCDIGWVGVLKGEDIIREGEEATLKYIDEIKKLLD